MTRKVIITCAITGSVYTPTMSPHLPITPEEITQQSIAAVESGAAILHLHARDPDTGQPSADPEVFMQFLPRIKEQCDAVINITTGGSSLMTLEQRLRAALQAQPEMASLNMGSMNFGLFPLKNRYLQWQHDWEPQLVEATRDTVFKNTFADIEAILSQLGTSGTRFEFECYDVGHIQTLAYFLKQGAVKKPLFVQFVLGVLGGIDAAPENLMHMKAAADRLLGSDYQHSVLGAGHSQMSMATLNAILGGHVRVGLEDSLTIGKGELASSNAQQVQRIRRIVEELGFEIATPNEARQLLQLKGPDKVNF
ncbi:MAG: 3-keto-5-aminohexanoate cleavage protein [Pseudomonadota bacterium]